METLTTKHDKKTAYSKAEFNKTIRSFLKGKIERHGFKNIAAVNRALKESRKILTLTYTAKKNKHLCCPTTCGFVFENGTVVIIQDDQYCNGTTRRVFTPGNHL